MDTTANKLIILSYKLYTVEDGKTEMMEEAPKEKPFQFISGMGTTLDTFEENVVNLAQGEGFKFTIPCDKAYGEYDEDHIIDLPRSTFEVDGHFDKDNIYNDAIVPLMDGEGNRMNATVIEVTDTIVKVDLNHPLAGADLLFEGSVIESRLATKEEMEGMANLLSSHDEECSCGCGGDCSGDCEGGDCSDGEEHHCCE